MMNANNKQVVKHIDEMEKLLININNKLLILNLISYFQIKAGTSRSNLLCLNNAINIVISSDLPIYFVKYQK